MSMRRKSQRAVAIPSTASVDNETDTTQSNPENKIALTSTGLKHSLNGNETFFTQFYFEIPLMTNIGMLHL